MKRWAAVAVVALVVVAGLGYAAYAWWLPTDHRETLGAGPVEGTVLVGPVGGTDERSGPCDGVAETPLVRLQKPLPSTAVTLCARGRDDVRRLHAELLVDELVAAYAEPDVDPRPGGSCPAMLAMPHAVVLVLDSGERLRLAVPVDACGFPRMWAERALDRAWAAGS